MSFSGKVVLITGASFGIGAGTALHFASLGAKLSLTARRERNIKVIAKECIKRSSESNVFTVAGDLTKEEDVKRIVEATVEHFGRLDVLINNAGLVELGTLETSTLENFDTIFNINVRAVYHLTSLAVPHLIQSKGNVVNVSNIASHVGAQEALLYSMSKAALDQFTKCTALELAPKQVRINSVNPAMRATDFLKKSEMSPEGYEMFLKNAKKSYPLGRLGEPLDVAKVIAFLASDEASFTTGAILDADGGKHLVCPR